MYRSTSSLSVIVRCAHHELRGKCLSDTEIPPNCAVALLNRLGWGSWIRDSESQVCQGLWHWWSANVIF
jgi:hypothetical protein